MPEAPPPARSSRRPEAEPASRRISAVWLVPLLALIIALGVAWRTYSSRGPLIEITFENAAGVEAGTTTLRFRDVVVGVVEAIDFTPDLSEVVVTARLDKDVARFADADAEFWVVRPSVTAQGVTGIETVISGVYIDTSWDNEVGEPQDRFQGLPRPPLTPAGQPGLRVRLRAANGGSMTIGAPILYKHIQVGKIEDITLTEAGDVMIDAFVNAPNHERLTEATRFWNASGFSIELGTGGASLNVASLVSLLQGGVSFDTVGSDNTKVEAGHIFELYPSETAARENLLDNEPGPRLTLDVDFDGSVHGLRPGAAVEFRGITVGEVRALQATLVDTPRRPGRHAARHPLDRPAPARHRARRRRGHGRRGARPHRRPGGQRRPARPARQLRPAVADPPRRARRAARRAAGRARPRRRALPAAAERALRRHRHRRLRRGRAETDQRPAARGGGRQRRQPPREPEQPRHRRPGPLRPGEPRPPDRRPAAADRRERHQGGPGRPARAARLGAGADRPGGGGAHRRGGRGRARGRQDRGRQRRRRRRRRARADRRDRGHLAADPRATAPAAGQLGHPARRQRQHLRHQPGTTTVPASAKPRWPSSGGSSPSCAPAAPSTTSTPPSPRCARSPTSSPPPSSRPASRASSRRRRPRRPTSAPPRRTFPNSSTASPRCRTGSTPCRSTSSSRRRPTSSAPPTPSSPAPASPRYQRTSRPPSTSCANSSASSAARAAPSTTSTPPSPPPTAPPGRWRMRRTSLPALPGRA